MDFYKIRLLPKEIIILGSKMDIRIEDGDKLNWIPWIFSLFQKLWRFLVKQFVEYGMTRLADGGGTRWDMRGLYKGELVQIIDGNGNIIEDNFKEYQEAMCRSGNIKARVAHAHSDNGIQLYGLQCESNQCI